MSVALGGIYTEPGASWTDNADGTGETFVGIYGQTGSFVLSGTVNTGSLGVYSLEYNKIDNAGNASGAIRTVTVQDTTVPVVTLSGSLSMNITVNTSYIEDGASWTDLPTNNSGTIPVATSGSVITTQTGVYTLEYSYTDGGGNTDTKIRTVTVSAVPDTTPPSISLYGSGLEYVEYGNDFTDS